MQLIHPGDAKSRSGFKEKCLRLLSVYSSFKMLIFAKNCY